MSESSTLENIKGVLGFLVEIKGKVPTPLTPSFPLNGS